MWKLNGEKEHYPINGRSRSHCAAPSRKNRPHAKAESEREKATLKTENGEHWWLSRWPLPSPQPLNVVCESPSSATRRVSRATEKTNHFVLTERIEQYTLVTLLCVCSMKVQPFRMLKRNEATTDKGHKKLECHTQIHFFATQIRIDHDEAIIIIIIIEIFKRIIINTTRAVVRSIASTQIIERKRQRRRKKPMELFFFFPACARTGNVRNH